MDQACIRCKALAADQPFGNAPSHGRLEQVTQQIAVAETTMTVLGERRMVWHTVGQIETAKPAIGEVQMDLFTQTSL
jgi:hypothetical protein